MEIKRAIEIITDEKKHVESHMNDAGKSPEYYQEMRELNEAYEIAIKALKLADCPQLNAECKACGGAFCDGEEAINETDKSNS